MFSAVNSDFSADFHVSQTDPIFIDDFILIFLPNDDFILAIRLLDV